MNLNELIKQSKTSLEDLSQKKVSEWTHEDLSKVESEDNVVFHKEDKEDKEDKNINEFISDDDIAQNASNDSGNSLYDATPNAIYRAANQLEIPIPKNKDFMFRNSRETLLDVFSKAVDTTAHKDGLWEKIRNISNDLSVIIALDSNFARMRQPQDSKDNRLVSHCINAAMIAMDIAKNLKNTEHSSQEIGMAALLHDIGFTALGQTLFLKENTLKLKKHVLRGVEVLKEMKVPEIIITMVSQHHERLDGKGFPNGIQGRDFLRSSQVLALAEGFERIMEESLNESSGKGVSQDNYVQKTLNEFHKALNQDILKAFISLRGFYPDGIMVELTNRSICIVLKQNTGFPLKPVVQVVIDGAGNHPDIAKIVDLHSVGTLSIIRAVTQNGGTI